jgi:type I restriction enzyme S subunit
MSAIATKRTVWREAKLGEILPLKYGKARSEQFGYPRPQTSTFGSNGAFGTFPRALTQGPAILVGRKGAAGTVHFSSEPCWPIDTTFYTEGNDGAFLPFFRYLLDSLQLVQMDRSTAVPSLSRDDYNSKIIFYPESLPEQRRIVAEIEKQFTRLEAGVAALRRVQANLKRYRAAVLKAACEGRLVTTEAELAKTGKRNAKFESGEDLLARILKQRSEKWSGKGKQEDPIAPNITKLPLLPDAWTWANIGQLRVFSLYGPRFSSDDYADDGYVVLRTSDISESGKVDTTKAPRLRLSAEDFEKYRAQRGDLLVTRTGSLGTLAIFDDDVEAIPGAYLIQFRLATEPITTRYLFYFLKSPIGHSYLSGKGAGVGRPNINAPTIEALPVPLPPLAEQTRIVAEVERRLSVVEELEAVVSANLQRATRLRQSILQKAFTGNL